MRLTSRTNLSRRLCSSPRRSSIPVAEFIETPCTNRPTGSAATALLSSDVARAFPAGRNASLVLMTQPLTTSVSFSAFNAKLPHGNVTALRLVWRIRRVAMCHFINKKSRPSRRPTAAHLYRRSVSAACRHPDSPPLVGTCVPSGIAHEQPPMRKPHELDANKPEPVAQSLGKWAFTPPTVLRLLNYVDFDLRHTLPNKAQLLGGRMRHVDYSSFYKRTTIVHSHNDGATGINPRHAQSRAEWQGRVSGS